jgi:hypothetical protein
MLTFEYKSSKNLKKIAAIGLLILLLYNMFGLSLTILFFEKDYRIASDFHTNDEYQVMKLFLPSLPYTGTWEKAEGLEGLIQKGGSFYNTTHVLHENDTLYVTLKSNQQARDHFFELANAMQILTDPKNEIPGNPYSKAINLLSSFFKQYIPGNQIFTFGSCPDPPKSTYTVETPYKSILSSFQIRLHTPPPELS